MRCRTLSGGDITQGEVLDAITERDMQVGRISGLQRVILDNAAYAIVVTEVDGTITLFNRAAELMLGYSAAELVGRCTPARFHYWPEIEARAEKYSRQFGVTIEPGFDVFVCRTQRRLPNEDEWTYVHKNGTHLTVLLGITALRDEDGEITGYIGNAHDISERRKAEQELRRSREQLEGAQRLARLGSWEFDLASKRLYWSPQMFELYAWKDPEPPSTLPAFLEVVHPDDRARVVQTNEDALNSDRQVTCEFYTNPARGSSRGGFSFAEPASLAQPPLLLRPPRCRPPPSRDNPAPRSHPASAVSAA
ncbi:MAG: PAS domain S-box protein [Blastochloris sp.]|nr:PAS domain S-box protein [Blastochloris sp.]